MAEEAIAKARAIAARLGGVGGGGGMSSELGKRKNRWDDDSSGGGGHHGLGALTKQKVYVPVRKYPEMNWIGLLIGPRGKTQKELEQRTGAKIVFRGRGSSKDGVPTGHPDEEEELHVSVEGPSDAVEKAVLELEDIFQNPGKADQLKQQQLRNLSDLNGSQGQQSSSIYGPGNGGSASGVTGPIGEIRMEAGEYIVDLEVPNNLVGYIIGKGGENIVKMQTQTGGHIQIAKEAEMRPGDTMRRVTIRGSEGAVKELKGRVEDVVTMKMGGSRGIGSGPKEQRELETSFVLKVVIPNDKVGLIIGKGGATVKMIQDKTYSTVLIPPTPDDDNPAVRTISIGAESREDVEACQAEISSMLQQQHQQLMSGASSYQPQAFTMTVPDDRVGIVIGKGGATIKELQNRHGVRIQIPTYADVGSMPPVRTVSITNGNGNELLVKAEIDALVDSAVGISSYGQQQYQQSYYGATAAGAGYYDPQAQGQNYYQGYAAYGAAGAAATTQQDPAAAPTDPTAYYPDFWNYASLYGEEAARAYYTTWSPPVGTQPPEGIVLPTAAAGAAGTATAPADGTAAANGEKAATDQSPEAVAAAWEVYNRQYAEWMATQAAADPAAVPQAVSAPTDSEQPPPPPNA